MEIIQMSPLDAAEHIAAFIAQTIKTYETEQLGQKPFNVFPGFLPEWKNRKEQQDNCPAIAVHPSQVIDNENESHSVISVLVCTYDDDMKHGHSSLSQILEYLRAALLTEKRVGQKFYIMEDVKTIIPAEQPFPRWWGQIDINVSLPQPMCDYSTIWGDEP